MEKSKRTEIYEKWTNQFIDYVSSHTNEVIQLIVGKLGYISNTAVIFQSPQTNHLITPEEVFTQENITSFNDDCGCFSTSKEYYDMFSNDAAKKMLEANNLSGFIFVVVNPDCKDTLFYRNVYIQYAKYDETTDLSKPFICNHCQRNGTSLEMKMCSGCKVAIYCDRKCQIRDIPNHIPVCTINHQ